MFMKTMIFSQRGLATLCLLSALALTSIQAMALEQQPSQSGAQSASAGASSPNDGSDYIAAWSVMGEICQDKYPDMAPAVEEFWTKRWDKATRERVAKMKQGADFKAKVAKHRVNLHARKDEILDQCGRLFTGGAH
jgi:hypothetical protein